MGVGLVVDSTPYNTVCLTCGHWCPHDECQPSLKCFYQEGKYCSSIWCVRKISIASSSFIGHTVLLFSIRKWVLDLPHSIALISITEVLMICRLQSPTHGSFRHISCQNSIDLAAYCTADIIRMTKLLLQAFFMKTVVSTFAHYYHIDGNYLRHLLVMDFL